MARGFGSTFGSGSSDRVASAYAGNPTTTSVWIRVLRNGEGGGSFGRIIQTAPFAVLNNNPAVANTYAIAEPAGGFRFYWSRPSAGVTEGIGISLDRSTASNAPIVYQGGSKLTEGSGLTRDGSVSWSAFSGTWYIGNSSASDRNWDGILADVAIWEAILTDEEFAALHAGISPLLIRPQSLVEYIPMLRDVVSYKRAAPTVTGTAAQPHPRVYMPTRAIIGVPQAGGGGTTTLTADPGSVTITGTAASLEFNRKLAADAGSVAITGTAASLEFNRKLAAAAGSVAVTGTAASLEYNRRLSAYSGSFQISGTAAALLKNSRLAAGSGSYIITGTDATLSKEGEIRLSAEPGSVVITGTAADLIYNSLTPAARTVPPAGGGSDSRRGARRRRVPYVLPDGRRIRLYPEEIADLVARGRLPATQRPVRPRPSVAAPSPASEPAPIVLPRVRDRSADIERLMAEARTAGRLADMVAGMAEGLSAAMAAERAAEDQRRRRRRRAAALLLLQ